MKTKFTETVIGKLLLYIGGPLLLILLTGVGTVLITSWNQPEINKQINRSIIIGDSCIKTEIKNEIKIRDNLILEKMENIIKNTDKLINRFDRHIDRSK